MKFGQYASRVRHQIGEWGESVVTEADAAQHDINQIVAKFQRTGYMPPSQREGIYADVTNLQGDLTERLEWAKQIMEQAQSQSQTSENTQTNPVTDTPDTSNNNSQTTTANNEQTSSSSESSEG